MTTTKEQTNTKSIKKRKPAKQVDYGYKNPVAFTMPDGGQLFKCNFCTFTFSDKKRNVTLVLELL